MSERKEKKKSLFSNKKTRIRNMLLIILPFVLAIGVFGYFIFSSLKSMVNNVSGEEASRYSDHIEGKNIYLREGATELQTELFHQLQDAYNGDNDELTAKLTAECFIADFYTWTNKNGSYDVGGVYYYANRPNIEQQGRDTFYKYVSYYINKYGKENLLEVTSINSVGGKIEEDYLIEELNQRFPHYYFEVTWEYANHPGFTANEYITKAIVNVIKDDTGRFAIVEVYG